MKRITTAVRAGTVLAALAVGVSTAAAPAYAAIVTHPFSADSGDGCGLSSGTLGWHLAQLPGQPSVVDVDGTLTDHPRPSDPANVCRDDRYSVASFTAYNQKTIVDSGAAKVDNGQTTIALHLTSASTAPIDLVVVQVCRVSASGTVASYCGAAVKYTP